MKEDRKELYLLALEVPGNIFAEINQLKNAIFKETGLVSCLALDAYIPLCFDSAPFLMEDFSDLRLQGEFCLSKPIVLNGVVYLGVNTQGLWYEACQKAFRDKMDALFMTYSGFFMGNEEADKILALLTSVSMPVFSGISILCMSLKVLAEPWYEGYCTEILWKQPLRKKI